MFSWYPWIRIKESYSIFRYWYDECV